MSGGTTLTKILITGGTGSLGSQLTQFYVNRGADVTVFSRDPHKQIALKEKVPNARYVLGDICDFGGLRDVIEGQDVVIHTAALKQVHVGEKQVNEFIRININGSMNVAAACKDASVPFALLISTDKAVEALNLYGRTKAVAESIFTSYGYSVVRYGNVVTESRGNFIEIWKKQFISSGKITLRVPDPTRFFLTMDNAIDLVLDAIRVASMGHVFIPYSLSSFNISSIAEALNINNYEYEPLISGEKQHEVLLSQHEQGEVVSDLLCKVWKGYNGKLNHADFYSL